MRGPVEAGEPLRRRRRPAGRSGLPTATAELPRGVSATPITGGDEKPKRDAAVYPVSRLTTFLARARRRRATGRELGLVHCHSSTARAFQKNRKRFFLAAATAERRGAPAVAQPAIEQIGVGGRPGSAAAVGAPPPLGGGLRSRSAACGARPRRRRRNRSRGTPRGRWRRRPAWSGRRSRPSARCRQITLTMRGMPLRDLVDGEDGVLGEDLADVAAGDPQPAGDVGRRLLQIERRQLRSAA